MFGREYELLKKLLKYTDDDLIFKKKILFRMIDIKDKKIKERKNLTKEETDMINIEYKLICDFEKEISNSNKNKVIKINLNL
jgi:hypothetical protein